MSQGFWFRSAVAGCALALAGGASAQAPATPPAVNSTLRVWGHGHRGRDYIQTLMSAWEAGFRKTHTSVRFENDLYGDASGIGSLYTGTGELAVLDREASFIEVDAYQQGTGYDPFRIPVARGSVSLARHAPALKIYVNHDNPLTHLTLAQLDGIFDADHRLSQRSYKTWGDLGLTGEWASKPIAMYAPVIRSAEMQFFERTAMKGSQKFSCCLTLLEASPSNVSAGAKVATLVANDRFGIGISAEASSAVREVPLAMNDTAAATTATRTTLTAATYPLARTVYIFVNRKPGSPLAPETRTFLEYILSPEGQAMTVAGGYLPLSPADAAKAREALR